MFILLIKQCNKIEYNTTFYCIFLYYYISHNTLPVSLNELKQRITTAAASVDKDMLRSVWTELDYRIDICRVTKGSRTEHL